jgi:ubiquinone/menaquinone biosynthesis C-methylase UbiE
MHKGPSTAWYDAFSNFYDAALDGTYRAHREAALLALAPEPGMTVVDVGCGTGASFALLAGAVGAQGRVLGVDASAGMLSKARRRAERHGFQNVELLDVSADAAPSQPWAARVGRVDRVQCFLSMSVIPDWKRVLGEWLDALSPGGKLVIADVYNEKPGAYARLVELTARAQITRRSWEQLSARTSDFELSWQKSSWSLGGQFFIARGTRGLVNT